MNGYLTKSEIREKFRAGNDMTKVNVIPPQINNADSIEGKSLRVAVYCRVSTDGLSQTTSFELQKKYYIRYVKQHYGWRLCGLYSDEGISATTIKNRIGLQLMIRDAVEGKIDLIVIKSISRFCRNLSDSLSIIKELKNLPKPVGIFFETENISTLDPAMDLIIKVLSMVAEEESKKKSEAITASCRQRYEEGFYNVSDILGYKKIGVNQIDIDADEALTVKIIYAMFMAGYEAAEIANKLIELGRRKHKHIYSDGSIKEGKLDWNAGSVLNILENEKRCGDILAQKTYTYDCIEHIIRKNDKKVPMYYAKDQHPAIISREEFYLARKIKKSNIYGWKYGLQSLVVYKEGRLKGYVRAVPNWHGYGIADYAKASLRAYGIEIPSESIYPEYVNESDIMKEISSIADDKPEQEHLYIITEEEFADEQILTDEDIAFNTEENKTYKMSLLELRENVRRYDNRGYVSVDSRFFSLNEKPVITLDRNGVCFTTECHKKLNSCESIVVYYNAVCNKLLIRAADEDDVEAVKLRWANVSGTCRCSAKALTRAIYGGNDWNEDYKYRALGKKISINGIAYVEFDLSDPIVRVSVKKCIANKEIQKSEDTILDKILEEVACTSDYYGLDDLDMKKMLDTDKVEQKSRAVYFRDSQVGDSAMISINDLGNAKYEPQFISSLLSMGKEPIEGWEYLRGMGRLNKYYYEISSSQWEYGMQSWKELSKENSYIESLDTMSCGWPDNYVVPSQDSVISEISALKDKGGML